MPAILGAGAARSLGKMKDCPICFGIGWVCENHPYRAWHEELGCMCGACKSNSGEEPDVSQVLVDEQDVTRH
jgi:hypothetical protein